MEQGKIVYQGKSKSGRDIIIRYPTKGDLKSLWEYINTLSKEQTFIRFQGKEITLEAEEKFLSNELKKIDEGKAVQLLAFAGNQLIAVADINMHEEAEKHIGSFGITVAKDFRNEGIGTKLMETAFKEAIKNLIGLQIIILGVFANNPVAINLYKKAGFVEFGNLPKGLLHKGKLVDHIYMYKTIDTTSK